MLYIFLLTTVGKYLPKVPNTYMADFFIIDVVNYLNTTNTRVVTHGGLYLSIILLPADFPRGYL